MLDGVPPYNGLLTHGFVVDGDGRKMSKSLGNTMAPQKISDTLGAEILRLWVASTDYSGELSISNEILKRVVESYRRIRNTLRFLLANTVGLRPGASTRCRSPRWVEIDRYALALTARMQDERARRDYARYQFHLVAQKLQTFCSEDLGAFYLDILKDRLYTCAADSAARRSAQTALWHITHSLLRLMAPILSLHRRGGVAGVHRQGGRQRLLPHLARASRRCRTRRRCSSAGETSARAARRGAEGDRGAARRGQDRLFAAAEVEIGARARATTRSPRLGDELRFVLITSARDGAERRRSRS